MNQRELKALSALINYNLADEQADYDQQDEQGRENHILNDLLILDQYVNTHVPE